MQSCLCLKTHYYILYLKSTSLSRWILFLYQKGFSHSLSLFLKMHYLSYLTEYYFFLSDMLLSFKNRLLSSNVPQKAHYHWRVRGFHFILSYYSTFPTPICSCKSPDKLISLPEKSYLLDLWLRSLFLFWLSNCSLTVSFLLFSLTKSISHVAWIVNDRIAFRCLWQLKWCFFKKSK